MKICFLLQRQFAYVGHALALWLAEKYGVHAFCAYVYSRWSYDFLVSQTEIPYSALLLDEDVHKDYESEIVDRSFLSCLEREFGVPHLWPYITLDRVVMFDQPAREYPYDTSPYSHEDMIKIFQVKARAILRFLDDERPDAVVLPNIGGIAPLLLYHIARRRGIRVLHLFPAAIASVRNRYLLTERYDRFTGVEELLGHSDPSLSLDSIMRAKEVLAVFRNNPKSYDARIATPRSIQSPLRHIATLPLRVSRWILWFTRLIGIYLRDKKHGDHSSENPWHYTVDKTKRKLRTLIGFRDLYDRLDPEEDFAFYPLHMDPETSTLLHAPFYTDQSALIAQIARSLPLHYKLYVKEHPFMVNYRPRSYYKKLKKIPNVKLIDPAIPGVAVVAASKLVITIVSTAGWEGLLLKKPVISFGDWFYNALSMVTRCHAIEQLPSLVKEQLTNFKYNEEELVRYLAAIFEDSVETDLGYLWERETNMEKKRAGLEPFADLIAKKLSLSTRKS